MKPAQLDLIIYQGSSYYRKITLYTSLEKTVTVDLTGATITAQFVQTIGGAALGTFVVTNSDLPNGEFEISLTKEVTAALTVTTGFWDLHILFSDATKQKYISGTYTLELET